MKNQSIDLVFYKNSLTICINLLYDKKKLKLHLPLYCKNLLINQNNKLKIQQIVDVL